MDLQAQINHYLNQLSQVRQSIQTHRQQLTYSEQTEQQLIGAIAALNGVQTQLLAETTEAEAE